MRGVPDGLASPLAVVLEGVVLLAVVGSSNPLAAQTPPDSQRLVLRTGATCHAMPDMQGAVAHRYRIGDVVHSSRSTIGMGRRPWHFDSWRVKGISPTCWIDSRETVPFDPRNPVAAYVALADSMLGRKAIPVEEGIELITLFEARKSHGPDTLELIRRFPVLALKRLELMDRILPAMDRWTVEGAPLQYAWIVAHQDLLRYFEPSASWRIPGEHYWAIIESNRNAPWAEDAAWVAAQKVPGVDECYAECMLSLISAGPQMYWSRFPNGRHITAALARADTLARYALKTPPQEPPTRKSIDDIRRSLAPVSSPARARLLEALAGLEKLVKPTARD